MIAEEPLERHIIIFYGLPGAGKSALARHIGEYVPDFYFADVASHPQFGQIPMHLCASQLYAEHGHGRHLVTEGVLRTPERRNRFARNIHHALAGDERFRFRKPRLIFLHETSATLSGRRPSRAMATYEEMMSEFVVGSGRYPHAILDGDVIDSLVARANWVMETIPAMTVDSLEKPKLISDLGALRPA